MSRLSHRSCCAGRPARWSPTACKPATRDVAGAQSALRSGAVPIVLGALAFDVDSPAALMAPRSVRRTAKLPDWPTGPLPAVQVAGAVPAPDEHRARVRRARDRLTAPGSTLQKVVLARALRLAADAPLDARVILRRLVADDPAAYGYLVDLSAAGGQYSGMALVGASPELLVARDGDRVTCQPFAGSAPRAADPELDAAAGAALADSAKDRHEHQLVIDTMAEALRPLCSELTIAPTPTAEPHHRAVASQHADQRAAARYIHDRNGFDVGPASHPGGRRGARRRRRRTDQRHWRATAGSTPAPSAGATRAVTGAGWCPSAARNWRPTAALRSPTPAAASSPNPIPMTKSPRPQRNSSPF